MNRLLVLMLAGLFVVGCAASDWNDSPPVTEGAPQPADTRPDFSGMWAFRPDRSSLAIRAPESSVFTIDHRDPHWRIERTHVYGGREDTLGFELLTDGVPAVCEIRGVEVHTRLYWEGDTLVFEASFTDNGEKSDTIVRYRLEDEGRTFVAEERMEGGGHSHRNTWVFERG